MSECSGDGIVLIIDRMSLRRTLLLQFVEHWAAANGLTVVASSDFSDIVKLRNPPNCRLVIFNVGGEVLGEPGTASTQQVVKAIYPNAPLVIIGDSTHPNDIEAVICSDASAYISSCLNAEVALAALSFVLAGGSYFPTKALRTFNSSGIHLPRNPSRQHHTTLADSNAEAAVAEEMDASSENDSSMRQVSSFAEHSSNAASGEHTASRCFSAAPEEDVESRTADQEDNLSDDDGSRSCGMGATDVPLDKANTSDFTARQHQVLACLKNGLSNKQIARELTMSEATVKVHVRHIMKKLGASNRTQAVILSLNTEAKRTTSKAMTSPPIQVSDWKGATRVN